MVYYSHGDGGPVGSYDVSDDLISRVTMGQGGQWQGIKGGGVAPGPFISGEISRERAQGCKNASLLPTRCCPT